MAGEVRPIAMGVGGIKFGTVGDGVPGADLKDYPLPTKGSVAFNFADPKEVKIEVEGSEEPFYVELVKDTTDYVEFSIPTPSNEVLKELAGGEVDTKEGKTSGKSLLVLLLSLKRSSVKHYLKMARRLFIPSLMVRLPLRFHRPPDQNRQSCCLFVSTYKQLSRQPENNRRPLCVKLYLLSISQ